LRKRKSAFVPECKIKLKALLKWNYRHVFKNSGLKRETKIQSINIILRALCIKLAEDGDMKAIVLYSSPQKPLGDKGLSPSILLEAKDCVLKKTE
jgi:hypothetical protein